MSEFVGGYPPQYTMSGHVGTFDGDQHRHLKPSSILKYQQEVGELHLSGGNMSYAQLYDNGLVFVLSRTSCKIYRPLTLEERFSLTTWHRENKGAQFIRCYRFTDAKGETVVESVTTFAMIDPHTHRVLRPKVFFEKYDIHMQPAEQVGAPDPGKLIIPDELPQVGVRTVRYSDTDYNGHLNNTVYADLLTDFIPGSMDGRVLTGYQISFLKEAREGEEIAIHAGADENGENAFLFRGVTERGVCFEGRCTVEESK